MGGHWKKKPPKDPIPDLAAELAVAGMASDMWKDMDAGDVAVYCLELARGILEPDEEEEDDGEDED